MSEGNFIQVNGSFVHAAEYMISLQETEGLLFAEKIRSVRSMFPFFRESLEIIKMKLAIFNHSFPELTDRDGAELKRQMERALTKNKHFLGAVLTLRFRYCEQKLQYSIQSTTLESVGYELNTIGLYISAFQGIRKSASSLSNTSLGSELYWRIVENHLQDGTNDQFLLMNTEKQIIEAIGSNIYVIKSGTVKGASIQHGAYVDATKPMMLSIFSKLQLYYNEIDGITTTTITEADEIFLVNAIDGIRWVVGFEGKRYFNNTIRKINELFIKAVTN